VLVEVEQSCVHVRLAFLRHALASDRLAAEYVLNCAVHRSAVAVHTTSETILFLALQIPTTVL